MIDVMQPLLLSQEPPRGADALLRACGGAIELQAIGEQLCWVLCLPPTYRVTEHLRYRSVLQYHLHLCETCMVTLCTNKNAETGEEWTALVLSWRDDSPTSRLAHEVAEVRRDQRMNRWHQEELSKSKDRGTHESPYTEK